MDVTEFETPRALATYQVILINILQILLVDELQDSYRLLGLRICIFWSIFDYLIKL